MNNNDVIDLYNDCVWGGDTSYTYRKDNAEQQLLYL